MNTKFTPITIVLAVRAMFVGSSALLLSHTTIQNKGNEHKYI